jgi:exopolysaccharide biosynthesis predicted pyruvyltransferase EpsI
MIRDFLTQYRGRPIIYVPNHGNAGDSLIAYATLQMFDELGLDYEIGSLREYEDKLIIYGGGGNLIGDYGYCRDFMYRGNNKDKNEIVILPHTIKDEDHLVEWLGDNITIFCREQASYNYVTRTRRKGVTYLDHDMAMHLRFEGGPGVGILNAFRTDGEKTNQPIPPDNIDLSEDLRCTGGTSDIAVIEAVALTFMDQIAQHGVVNTNRLHIAIAGALLGLEVNLYNNSYWKNREVYDYSLRDMSNVQFHDLGI